jgi:AcrR family transcriptional regulator
VSAKKAAPATKAALADARTTAKPATGKATRRKAATPARAVTSRAPAKKRPAKRSSVVGGPGGPAQGRELRARGQRTMRKLLDAGIGVFAARGYHAARVDDVVKAAHTSHGTFYLYFANKEDLFQALVADVAEQMATLAGSLGPVTADAAGRTELRAWLARFTDLYEHYGTVLRTWTEAEIDASEMGRVGTDLLGDLAGAVAAAVRPADIHGIDATIATIAMVAMVERFNYFVLSEQVDAHRAEMLDTLAAVMHDGLFGPGV